MLIFVAILMMPVSAIISGFVLKVMWGWFIVPVFHLPILSIPQAIGISLIVGFLTFHESDAKKDDTKTADEKIVIAIVAALVRPAIILPVAWIVRMFL